MTKETKTKKGCDSLGWKRGERGYGRDADAHEFRRPAFDRAKQQGELGVGQFPYVMDDNAQIEGDDV
jgi:hypothetical protein